jgi:hypothetical protein
MAQKNFTVVIKIGLMDKLERAIKSTERIILKCGLQLDESEVSVMSAEKKFQPRAPTIVWMAFNRNVPSFVAKWFQFTSNERMLLRSNAPRLANENRKWKTCVWCFRLNIVE